MSFTAGIDIGSISTEMAVVDSKKSILASSIFLTGSNIKKVIEQSLNKVLKDAKINREELKYIVATGYGRLSVDFADREITEITCHAVGAHFLYPKTRTVIDIGGQDSKVIALDENGKVIDFIMNDKCAAGTGRFLEVMAHALETKIEELGPLSLQSHNVLRISSMCTVFTESEVVSRIAEGCSREDIASGIHRAIVDRILTMAHKVGTNNEVTLTGGVSKNIGVIEMIKSRISKEINVPSDPQIIGALGAAILARNYVK